jgi:hypothetical protein
VDLVFFDTTSLYFKGRGGDSVGKRGHCKDPPARSVRWSAAWHWMSRADRSAARFGQQHSRQKFGREQRNKGYRRYLKVEGSCHFAIDEDQVKAEQRYDPIWVLRTNTNCNAGTMAHVYKARWTVEDIFRTTKSILETRPIYHKRDEIIRGHMFCSFLALVLKQELESCIQPKISM